jgi:hypothetical protein
VAVVKIWNKNSLKVWQPMLLLLYFIWSRTNATWTLAPGPTCTVRQTDV